MGVRVRCFLHVLFGLFVLSAIFALGPSTALAGFGITPPYVNNERLTRGTSFEQRIVLVRSDPTDDLRVQITLNIPGIESWFSVDKGSEFILPKGETQTPIVVHVSVPPDAEYKEYKGAIRIRTSSANQGAVDGVSIALGAQVDVDLKVVDKILDFDVRRIRMSDLEEGHKKWGLFFPAKIKFFMTIENTGNEQYGPTKVHFDVYDADRESLLESIDNTNTIENVAPFSIKEVIAELPTRLPAGRYIGKYTIYKGNEVAQQNEVTVSISTLGAVPGYEGYGFMGLSTPDKIKIASILFVPVFFLIVLLIVLLRKRRARRRR